MRTQSDISSELQGIIPPELWLKYGHLSYAEMAEQADMAEYADLLLAAENEWFKTEK